MKTAKMCRISTGIHVSHETVRKSIPPIQVYGRMESSGFFLYDEQYVNIGGKRTYRFLLKCTITMGFHKAILPDLGEYANTSFILDALNHFSIGSLITITTEGYHYNDAFSNISRQMHINVKRQRCLFHVLKGLTKKAYDSGRMKELRGAIDLINCMFFQTPENLERLGKNTDPVKNMVSGLSQKDATFRILDLVHDIYSGDPIIGKFLRFLRTNRKVIFRYLEDPKINKIKNDEGLLRTSYWYHRLSTES